jgi:hypothetical protein
MKVILSIPMVGATAKKVPINISDVTGKGVLSAEVCVVCDPDAIEIQGFDQAGSLTLGQMSAFNNYVAPYSPSQVMFVFASPTPISGEGALVYLKVKNLKKKPAGLMITYFLLNEDTVFGVKPHAI